MRSSKSVPGAHLICEESRSAGQSLSTRMKLGDLQYIAIVRLFTLMPRLVKVRRLDELTAAQRERRLWRSNEEAVRHLIGVLQPAFEACVAMQRTRLTVADALGLVCRLRRTMRLGVFPCPKPYEKPLAVGRDANHYSSGWPSRGRAP